MKEIVLIYKRHSFWYALYYFFYKIKLGMLQLPFFKNYNQKCKKAIDNIYTTLMYQQLHSTSIHNAIYFIQPTPFKNTNAFLRPNSSDAKVYQQVLLQQEYKSVIEIYNQFFIAPPLQLIDCGANIGLASLYFAIHFPTVSITAIEPFLQNSIAAEINLEKNNVQNYTLLQGGVWNKNTSLFINRNFRDGKEWSINLIEKGDENTETIKGFCLATIINKIAVPIDILKIDIEGAEKELFNNDQYAASFLSKVKCIAIEIHDEFNCRNDIYAVLRKNGFFYYNSNELTIGLNKKYCM